MTSEPLHQQSPHDLCTHRAAEECAGCDVSGDLMCRFETGDLASFLLGFLPFGIAVVAGMIRGGYGWWLLGWLAIWLLFFFVLEGRMLCSHCPYWAEESRVLHCHANYGVIKLWKFRPGPMSRLEKVLFGAGAAVFGFYPVVFLILGGQWLLLVIALTAIASSGLNLRKNVCVRCINFSCPANAVPKSLVDAYLLRNPVMRRAWEANGYALGE
jgi:hypothetical protein